MRVRLRMSYFSDPAPINAISEMVTVAANSECPQLSTLFTTDGTAQASDYYDDESGFRCNLKDKLCIFDTSGEGECVDKVSQNTEVLCRKYF